MSITSKKVNIYALKRPVTLKIAIRGTVYGMTLPVEDIFKCICQKAKVEEILSDGSLVQLNFQNYNTDNENVVAKDTTTVKVAEPVAATTVAATSVADKTVSATVDKTADTTTSKTTAKVEDTVATTVADTAKAADATVKATDTVDKTTVASTYSKSTADKTTRTTSK